MSLLDDIELIKNDYIEISDVIDVIAKYEQSYDKARIILQHYKYEEHLTCYHINDCFQVFDNDGLGNPILIDEIIQSLRIYEHNRDFIDYIENKTDDECFVLIGQIYHELKTLYWKKSELLNFYPINKLFSDDDLKTNSKESFFIDKIIGEDPKNENNSHQSIATKKENVEVTNSIIGIEKISNTRAENNVTKLILVLAEMANIDITRPHSVYASLLQQAELLGIEKFPSDDTIKNWFVKASKHKSSENPS